MMQPRHEGRPDDGWQLRWLWWTFVLATLAVALLIPAYRIGDPFEDPAHPLAEALGSFGYFCLVNAVIVGGAGLLAWIRDRRRGRRAEGEAGHRKARR